MKRQALAIDLLEDCVFSASAATEGGHESLDYIPGAALLGAVASRRYDTLDRRVAYTLFHSGKLRFSDATPWDGQAPGWPTPLCWHYEKLADYKKEDRGATRLNADNIINRLHDTTEQQRQLKQMRGGYIHADGRYTIPARELRLKTAIAPETGRAEEAQLFGYDALLRGQLFVAFVEADDDIDQAQFDGIIDALSGEQLLGRSRSAEYGRCAITPIELDPPQAGNIQTDELILWLLSDLALADVFGNPKIEPAPEDFGLEGCKIDWSRTFLRTRRYSPWNSARRGYDNERLVVQAGSIMTFSGKPDDPGALQQLNVNGAGLYRETGLGRMWVNSPLLATKCPQFDEPAPLPRMDSEAEKPVNDPLIQWLKSRADIDWRDTVETLVQQHLAMYNNAIDAARRFNGVTGDIAYGPSRSQWAGVGSVARNQTGRKIFEDLFQGDKARIKPKGDGWNIEIPVKEADRPPQKLADLLKEKLAFDKITSEIPDTHKNRAYALFIQRLADRIADVIETRGV